QGVHLWSYRYGSDTREQADAVATGPDGSALVTGRFETTLSFSQDHTLVGGNNLEVFVVKLAY
ncbi:MAG: hypothetical protein DRI90_24240, partial [Deltaproteobacteria bacterium]